MDKALRHQVLRAAISDRAFLKQAWRDINPDDFPDRGELVVAKAAVEFYEKYQQPIGAMLRSWVDDITSSNGHKFGAEAKQKLKDLITLIQTPGELVSVQALVDRVKSLKKTSFYDKALDEMLAAHEGGTLSSDTLQELVEKAARELAADQISSTDYFSSKDRDARIAKRELWHDNKYPRFLIDPLDQKIHGIGRGQLGVWIAPPNGGKGPALLHMARAYALQGLNVLHITLEDPKEVVEDRLDAILTGIPLNKLRALPNRFRKRWARARKMIRGRIKIVDGTDMDFTVSLAERIWDLEKRNGFTADAISIDYDDEIMCEKSFKGESARRFEFAEIYRRLRRLATKTDTIVWTAAQGKRETEGKKVLTMKDVAEDFSKVRKAFLGIGIGKDPKIANLLYLYVMRHRTDRSRFGVEVMSNFDATILYDEEATTAYLAAKRMAASKG